MKVYDLAYTAKGDILAVVENETPGVILLSNTATFTNTLYKFVHAKKSGIMVATINAEDEVQAFSKFMQELALYK